MDDTQVSSIPSLDTDSSRLSSQIIESTPASDDPQRLLHRQLAEAFTLGLSSATEPPSHATVLLKVLVETLKPTTLLQIGVYDGHIAKIIARLMTEWQGHLDLIEPASPQAFRKILRAWPASTRSAIRYIDTTSMHFFRQRALVATEANNLYDMIVIADCTCDDELFYNLSKSVDNLQARGAILLLGVNSQQIQIILGNFCDAHPSFHLLEHDAGDASAQDGKVVDPGVVDAVALLSHHLPSDSRERFSAARKLRTFPNSADSARRYKAFISAYEGQRFGDAAAIFLSGLSNNPEGELRWYIRSSGGATQLVEALSYSGRLQEAVERLNDLFLDYPYINIVDANIAWNVQHVAELREQRVADGLPSILLASQGKSGSATVSAIFNAGFDLPAVMYALGNDCVVDAWAKDYSRGGACHTTHLAPTPSNIRSLRHAGIGKVIVHMRDPRQALLSAIHHIETYPDQVVLLRRAADGEVSVTDRARNMIGFFENTICWIAGWIKAAEHINILFSTFEELVRDQGRLVERYIDFFGREHASKFNYKKALMRDPGKDYHFRKGETDEWRTVFTHEFADELSARIPQYLKEKFEWYD